MTTLNKGRFASLGLDELKVSKKEKTKIDIVKPMVLNNSLSTALSSSVKASLPMPNAQQQAVIASKAGCVRVHALAGTGKSTTVLHMLNNKPNVPTLYVVFNSLLKTEMEERIHSAKIKAKVTVKTLHGYAYQWMSQNFFNGMGVNICQNRIQFSNAMGIVEGDPSTLEKFSHKVGLVGGKDSSDNWESSEHYLNNIYRTLKNFYQSTDNVIENKHIAMPRYAMGGKVPLNTWIALDAHKIWIYMRQNPDQFAWDFEAMIRFMALDKTPWPFERIILDEAQDSSYFFAHAMYEQTHAQRIYLGDPHQSIYQFRNAFDATQPNIKNNNQIPDTVLTLSETHRFGPDIADLANKLLEIKGSKDRLIGKGSNSNISFKDISDVDNPDKTTYIAATNNQLLDIAFKRFLDNKPYIITGDKEVTIQDALDLLALKKGFLTSIQSSTIKKFKNYEDLETYVEESGNDDYGVPMEWIKNPLTMHALPKLKYDILTKFTKDVTKIDLGNTCVLSTAHQLKGFTVAGDVFVCNDFNIPTAAALKSARDNNSSTLKELESQINVAYVAITRGSHRTIIDTKLAEKIIKADRTLSNSDAKTQKAVGKRNRISYMTQKSNVNKVVK